MFSLECQRLRGQKYIKYERQRQGQVRVWVDSQSFSQVKMSNIIDYRYKVREGEFKGDS